MSKGKIKGSPDQIVEKTIAWRDSLKEEDFNKTYESDIHDLRGRRLNNYYQILLKWLASETGEIDFDSLPRKVSDEMFELYKRKIKKDLGYTYIYTMQTKKGEMTTTEYISTTEMSTKQLLKFIEKIEGLVLSIYPNVDLTKFRKESEKF